MALVLQLLSGKLTGKQEMCRLNESFQQRGAMPSTSLRICRGVLILLAAAFLLPWGSGARDINAGLWLHRQTERTPMPPKRIVFVCVENSCRSQMAEAFARLHAPPGVELFSAGSRPSGKVNPRAVEFMKEIGYDLARHQSKGLDALPALPFTAAITMGCGDECAQLKAALHEDWAIPDPKELPAEEFRQIRALIESKVKDLLSRI